MSRGSNVLQSIGMKTKNLMTNNSQRPNVSKYFMGKKYLNTFFFYR